jgi:hypothetical protein
MNGRAFKLGTFARPNGDPFAAIVLGDEVVDLRRAYEIYRDSARRNALTSTNSILDVLQNWDANFPVLQEIVAFLDKEGLKPGAANLSGLRALPPVLRPGKMFYAAQNFQEHVDEMIRAGMSPAGGPRFTGEKSTTRPYLFLKAPSCLAGAYDDIQIPLGMSKIDWEAEIALAIGTKGKLFEPLTAPIRAHQGPSRSSATTHPRIAWIATRPGFSALRMMVSSWSQSSSSARSTNSRTAPAMKSGAIMAAAAARRSTRAATFGSSVASTALATSGRSRLAIRSPSMRPILVAAIPFR